MAMSSRSGLSVFRDRAARAARQISTRAHKRFEGAPRRHLRGASLTEFGMVAGLVAVATIGAVITTGQEVERVFCTAADRVNAALGGEGYDCDLVIARAAPEPDAPPPPISPDMELVVDVEAGDTVTFQFTDAEIEIDWGDGTPLQSVDTSSTATLSHTYASSGTFTVAAAGTAEQFTSQAQTSLVEVVSFGADVELTSLFGAFVDHDRLDRVARLPDTVTDIRRVFEEADGALAGLDEWDTSGISQMDRAFRNAASMNVDLSELDVSGVSNFARLFEGASNFDADLSEWNMSSATVMTAMFAEASSFDADLSDWDVSGVIDFGGMFDGASSFDADLSGWDVTSATQRTDFDRMFRNAASFTADLSGWCVEPVTSTPVDFDLDAPMTAAPLWGSCLEPPFTDPVVLSFDTTGESDPVQVRIFVGDTGAVDWGDGTIELGNVNTQHSHMLDPGRVHTVRIAPRLPNLSVDTFRVTGGQQALISVDDFGDVGLNSLAGAFQRTDNLASLAEIPARIQDFTGTFAYSNGTLAGVEDWDMSSAIDLSEMFRFTGNFNRPIGGWSVGGVRSMIEMFYNADAFNQPLDTWDVRQVESYSEDYRTRSNETGFDGMFFNADAFAQDLSMWCVERISTYRDYQPSSFASNASPIIAEPLWGSCGRGTMQDAVEMTFSGGQTVRFEIEGNAVIEWPGGIHESAASSQRGNSDQVSRQLSGDGASRHTVRIGRLQSASGNPKGGVARFAVTGGQQALISVDDFGDVGLNSLAGAFQRTDNLASLAEIPARIQDFTGTFAYSNGTLAGVEDWDMSSAIDLSEMFRFTGNFNRPIGGWSVGGVRSMIEMFYNADAFNQPLDTWDVRQVESYSEDYRTRSNETGFDGMFFNADAFAQDLSMWCVSRQSSQSAYDPASFSRSGSSLSAAPRWGDPC